jgi:acyl dehydratase
MPLNHSLVGEPGEPLPRSWTSTDTILYALGVGAGSDDALSELAFTTENTQGVNQQVLPTFAVLAAQARGGRARRLGEFDPARLVHAEQSFELHRPLPVSAEVTVTSTITSILDKGKGALMTTRSEAVDAGGQLLVTAQSGVFIGGEGGFGGERGAPSTWQRPDRPPDEKVTYTTRPDQALLYRLSGDRNPLHSDPSFARRGGFDRPILHGLCTYGFTGRALLHALCGSDPARMHSMSGRFSRPVLPGQTLTISIWVDADGEARFQTATEDGTVVIDHGLTRYS